jgi:hypothetical protein
MDLIQDIKLAFWRSGHAFCKDWDYIENYRPINAADLLLSSLSWSDAELNGYIPKNYQRWIFLFDRLKEIHDPEKGYQILLDNLPNGSDDDDDQSLWI